MNFKLAVSEVFAFSRTTRGRALTFLGFLNLTFTPVGVAWKESTSECLLHLQPLEHGEALVLLVSYNSSHRCSTTKAALFPLTLELLSELLLNHCVARVIGLTDGPFSVSVPAFCRSAGRGPR